MPRMTDSQSHESGREVLEAVSPQAVGGSGSVSSGSRRYDRGKSQGPAGGLLVSAHDAFDRPVGRDLNRQQHGRERQVERHSVDLPPDRWCLRTP